MTGIIDGQPRVCHSGYTWLNYTTPVINQNGGLPACGNGGVYVGPSIAFDTYTFNTYASLSFWVPASAEQAGAQALVFSATDSSSGNTFTVTFQSNTVQITAAGTQTTLSSQVLSTSESRQVFLTFQPSTSTPGSTLITCYVDNYATGLTATVVSSALAFNPTNTVTGGSNGYPLLTFYSSVVSEIIRETEWFCEYAAANNAGPLLSAPSANDISLRTGDAGQCKYGRIIYYNAADVQNRTTGTEWQVKAANIDFSTAASYTLSWWFSSAVSGTASQGASHYAYWVTAGVNTIQYGVYGTSAGSSTGYPFFTFNVGGRTTTGTAPVSVLDGNNHFIAVTINNANSNSPVYTMYVDGFLSSTGAAPTTFSTFTGYNWQWTLPNPDKSALLTISNANTAVEIQRLFVCQQSLQQSRCVDPTTSIQNMTISYQVTGVNPSVTCNPLASNLYATDLYEASAPTSYSKYNTSALFVTSQWSLGVWVYETNVQQATTLFSANSVQVRALPVPSNTAQTTLQVSIGANTQILSNFHFAGLVSWHHLMISYNNGTVTIFVDQIAQTTYQVAFSNNLGGLTVSALGSIAQLKYYPFAFNAVTVRNEYTCHLQASGVEYEPPVGYCRQAADSDGTQGYCRFVNMCQGHCEAFNSVNPTTQTMNFGGPECDVGYEAPSCLSKCSAINSVTGECLQSSNFVVATATGVVPNSEWCLFLRNYRVATGFASNGRQTLAAVPRKWTYDAVITIPTGAIVSVESFGSCPQITLSQDSGQGLTVLMQNTGSVDTSVQVQLQQVPSSDPSFIPDPQCNDEGGLSTYTVPAYSAIQTPAAPSDCGNMTVSISRLAASGSYVSCTMFSADQVAASITNVSSVPASVNAYVTSYVSQVSTDLSSNQALLFTTTLSLIAQTLASTSAQPALMDYISTQIAAIQNFSAQGQTNYSQFFQNNFDLKDAAYVNLTNEIAGELSNASDSNVQIALDNGNVKAAVKLLDVAIKNLTTIINDTMNANNNTQNLYNYYNSIKPPTTDDFGSGFLNWLEESADHVGEAIEALGLAAVKDVEGIASGVLGIGGIIGNILDTAVNVLIIGGVAYIVYSIVTRLPTPKYSRSKEVSNDTQAPRTAGEGSNEVRRRNLMRGLLRQNDGAYRPLLRHPE